MSCGTRKPKKIAVFISGGGSTLQALLELHHQFNIQLVVTNKKNVRGELKAKRFGVPVFHFPKSMSFSELSAKLKGQGIDQIFLAGFMKILPKDFVSEWENKIFNIHPSLLPVFPGLHGAEKSYEAAQDMGVTIHQVNDKMDEGQIFLQQKSLAQSKKLSFSNSMFLLRRTEQQLLREFALRKGL